MESPVLHPRPVAGSDEPAAKHRKSMPSTVFEEEESDAFHASVIGFLPNPKPSLDDLQLGGTPETEKVDFDDRAPGRYKTSLCSYFRKKGCKHDKACRYAHGEQELQPRPDGSWDPTSDRAKRIKAEQDMMARMTMVNSAKVETGSREDGEGKLGSDTVREYTLSLPRTWTTDSLQNFLDKNVRFLFLLAPCSKFLRSITTSDN